MMAIYDLLLPNMLCLSKMTITSKLPTAHSSPVYMTHFKPISWLSSNNAKYPII